MKFFYPIFCFFLILTACQNQKKLNLTSLQKKFIKTICESEVEEGPFHFNYNLKTVFFSDEIVSLFGSCDEYTNLPHGHGCYEGKTYYKVKGKSKSVSLNDLFISNEQKEFLRNYCEKDLKTQSTYFSDSNNNVLISNATSTFVINHRFLIIIFQPYTVGSYSDGPFVVKIPFESLKNKWNYSHPFVCLLEKVLASKSFISSWEEEDFQMSVEASHLSTVASLSQDHH